MVNTQHQYKMLHWIVMGKKRKMFLVWNNGVLCKDSWLVCAGEEAMMPAVQHTANLHIKRTAFIQITLVTTRRLPFLNSAPAPSASLVVNP